MMINIGGYVFGYDEEKAEKKGKAEILCFKNRRLRYSFEIPDVLSREQLRRYCEKLIPIFENVPDEYLLKCFNYDDLAEDFEG